jgi:hypothetical protein
VKYEPAGVEASVDPGHDGTRRYAESAAARCSHEHRWRPCDREHLVRRRAARPPLDWEEGVVANRPQTGCASADLTVGRDDDDLVTVRMQRLGHRVQSGGGDAIVVGD